MAGCSGLISELRLQPSSQLGSLSLMEETQATEMIQRGPGGPAQLFGAQPKAPWAGGPPLPLRPRGTGRTLRVG